MHTWSTGGPRRYVRSTRGWSWRTRLDFFESRPTLLTTAVDCSKVNSCKSVWRHPDLTFSNGDDRPDGTEASRVHVYARILSHVLQ
jgi:hypothetical protein